MCREQSTFLSSMTPSGPWWGSRTKHEGASRARMTAMELVSPGLISYLSSLAALARSQPRRRLAIMCWRGGERSRNVVLLLALIGVHVVTGHRGL